MDQQALIAAVVDRMAGEEAVRGLFLAGSYGRGTEDEWSDVDLIALVAPEHQAAVAGKWRQVLSDVTPIVFWNELNRGGLVINAVSEDWLRCDLSIAAPDAWGKRAKNTVKPLIDRDGVYEALPERLPPRQPDKAGSQRATQAMLQMRKLDVAALEKAYAGG